MNEENEEKETGIVLDYGDALRMYATEALRKCMGCDGSGSLFSHCCDSVVTEIIENMKKLKRERKF